jgi:hypothetical protein
MLPQRVIQVALLLRVEGGVGLCLVGVAVGALVDAPAGLFSAPRLLQPSSTLFAITFIKGAEGPHNNVWGNGKMESHVTTDSMADRPTGRQFGVHAPSIFRPQYSSSMLWPDVRIISLIFTLLQSLLFCEQLWDCRRYTHAIG